MDVKNAAYILTAVKPEQYPKHDLPEVALLGRSNVGKSSIINTLVNQKNLARKSATPGKTREINFYSVNDQLYLVDLPGYGYAKVSKAAKTAWDEMINTYLNTRQQLRLFIMLVDIRHAPSKEDQVMAYWLRSQDLPYFFVATKLDKITRNQTTKQLNLIRTELEMEETEVLIPFSAVTKQGREEVWRQVEDYLYQA